MGTLWEGFKGFSIITKIAIGTFCAFFLLIFIILLALPPDPQKSVPQQPVNQVATSSSVSNDEWLKPESEKDFKKSCKDIVFDEHAKGVYYKEFLKNPNKFIGERLHFQAKIMHIEESGNKSFIQASITRNWDSAIIEFYGTMKIYNGDIIWVWGEGDGTFEGKNGMGYDMLWPRVLAKYIKKVRSED